MSSDFLPILPNLDGNLFSLLSSKQASVGDFPEYCRLLLRRFPRVVDTSDGHRFGPFAYSVEKERIGNLLLLR